MEIQPPQTVESLFALWRLEERPRIGWGLSWYLSLELCRRYYRSHGIAPFALNHGGLGYYGIELTQLPCGTPNRRGHKVLGRLTMAGDLERWASDSVQGQACALRQRCAEGASPDALVSQAVRHLGLHAVPAKPHGGCHHKRRGDSFVLLWEMATHLALQVDLGLSEAQLLANGLEEGKPFFGLDGPPVTYQRPGHFWFRGTQDLYITDEGILCDGSGESLWERYMAGESPAALATWLRGRLTGL